MRAKRIADELRKEGRDRDLMSAVLSRLEPLELEKDKSSAGSRKNAKKAMDRLERRGCEAADCRLEGDEVERCCVVDLGRDWRMIVAFPEHDEVAVILVGRHIAGRCLPPLYESVGIELPTITQRRGHASCPTGEAPVDHDLVDTFIAHGRQLPRLGRGRQPRL